jgi:hypothetical protein
MSQRGPETPTPMAIEKAFLDLDGRNRPVSVQAIYVLLKRGAVTDQRDGNPVTLPRVGEHMRYWVKEGRYQHVAGSGSNATFRFLG